MNLTIVLEHTMSVVFVTVTESLKALVTVTEMLDALGVCGGSCSADADSDGVCDDVDDCVGAYDECGVCNGNGIAEGSCDCDGNVLDDCGVCGGDNSSCFALVVFSVDMNLVDYPNADYDNVVVNGSWNGWQGWGVQLSDDYGDGVFTGSLLVNPGTTFEYVVAVTGAADGWSGWGIQWGDGCENANVVVTAGEAGTTTSTSLDIGCDIILGCMDENASNYDSSAEEQAYDQYGNLGVYMLHVMIFQHLDVYTQMDLDSSTLNLVKTCV